MKIAAISGILGSTLITFLILMATLLSPWFSWQQNALSDLGVGEVALIFNSTVFTGGLLNLIFSYGIKKYLPKNSKSIFGVASLILASISLSLVGIFTIDYSLIHTIVALCYFLLSPIALILISLGAKNLKIKRLSLYLGSLTLIAILLLPIILISLSFEVGFAVPEIIHSLILGIWTMYMASNLFRFHN